MSVGDAGVPHGEDEVDEEDDPGGDGHDAENEATGQPGNVQQMSIRQHQRLTTDHALQFAPGNNRTGEGQGHGP